MIVSAKTKLRGEIKFFSNGQRLSALTPTAFSAVRGVDGRSMTMKSLMRNAHWKIVLVLFALVWPNTGLVFAQQIRVVASWPALADISKQIGKELVSVDSLATGVEDPHGVPMKPSFVPRLNRADVLV